MRKILTLLTAFFLLFNTHKAAAQTFSVQHDTVYYNGVLLPPISLLTGLLFQVYAIIRPAMQ